MPTTSSATKGKRDIRLRLRDELIIPSRTYYITVRGGVISIFDAREQRAPVSELTDKPVELRFALEDARDSQAAAKAVREHVYKSYKVEVV